MSARSNHEATAEKLSALMDGELDAMEVAGACAVWRDSDTHRATWHAFHLIGDVMRSDDLATSGRRDAALLARLRERLADEPVVLAPLPLAAPVLDVPVPLRANGTRSRRRSMGSAAVAAGFVAVAGVLVVTRAPAPTGAVQVAVTQAPAVPTPAPSAPVVLPARVSVESAPEPELLIANGRMLRDARIDRYLSAHQQFAGSSALGVPSAFLRSATADAANR